MTHVILPEAQEEFESAVRYLNEQESRLGEEFRQEILGTLQIIISHPEHGSLYDGDLRYRPVKRFRYLVIYSVRNKSILIVAIMHESRRPGYWKTRLQKAPKQD